MATPQHKTERSASYRVSPNSFFSGCRRFVDPITVKVPTDRQTAYPSSKKVIDVAGQRGECERVQVWGFDTSQPLTVRIPLADSLAPPTASAGDTALHPASALLLSAAASPDSPRWHCTALPVLSQNTKLVFPKVAKGAELELPSSIWSYKQQGYVYANSSKHYTCIEDVLNQTAGKPPPPPPPPGPRTDCDQTPWNECWTGCPQVAKNFSDPKSCNGGRTPNPFNHDGKGNLTSNHENLRSHFLV